MNEIEIIGNVHKNAMEDIEVRIREYRGVVYVDTRVWVRDPQGQGKGGIATKKGLCLRSEVLKELLPLLAEARAKAEVFEHNSPRKGNFL